MKINAYLIFGYIFFLDTRVNGAKSFSTTTHCPNKEKLLTTISSPTRTPVTTAGVSPSTTEHQSRGAQFHTSSFLGGMMVAFVITLAGCVGYRLACARQEVRYRAIEEHDAII